MKNSIRDARTPQPGEIVFNTTRYSSDRVQRSGDFQSSVSYIKVQIKGMVKGQIKVKSTLDKANIELTKWQLRQITPIGKITVLKSLILSKFIHAFSILPIPDSFVKTLNSIFYKFLWNNKPDKIKRGTMFQLYRWWFEND